MAEELIKVGIIGTGNCGGQLVDLAVTHGFSGIAVNASQKDLNLLTSNVLCFTVGDGKGTGKNREEAKKFFDSHITILKDDNFIKFINNCDVIVIATSTGGGFGSGASLALTESLIGIYPDKAFIPAGVLPFDEEGYTAQTHTIEWLQELSELGVPYMLYDNNRFAGKPQKEVCEIVNEQFVSDLMVIRGDYINETRLGGVDERDMLTTLSTPGRIVIDSIDEIEEADIIDNSIVKTIKEHIKNESAHSDMVEDKEIRASVMMYTLSSTFDPYKGSIKADVQDTFGEHISDYSNYTDIDDDSEEEVEESAALILAGLSEPAMRIDKVINRQKKLEDDILGRKKVKSKLGKTKIGNDALKLNAKSFATGVTPSKRNIDEVLRKHSSSEESSK